MAKKTGRMASIFKTILSPNGLDRLWTLLAFGVALMVGGTIIAIPYISGAPLWAQIVFLVGASVSAMSLLIQTFKGLIWLVKRTNLKDRKDKPAQDSDTEVIEAYDFTHAKMQEVIHTLPTGEKPKMRNRLGIWIEDRRTGIILLIFGFGFITLGIFIGELTKISERWEEEARTGIVALGTAFAIAGILTLTVDRQLKYDIAEDAFRKIMGWVSPGRLQSELEAVYRIPFFAIEHRMTVTLTETLTGFMRMELDIRRTIRNESLQSRPFTPSLTVRDWREPGRESAITEISAYFRGKSYIERTKVKPDNPESTDLLEKLAMTLTLNEKEEVTVFYKSHEDKLLNDVHSEVFLTPTENPTVEVIHPASFGAYVEFSSFTGESQHERESQAGGQVTSQWSLKGRMLPSQPIYIRWWPKAPNKSS